MRAIYIGLIASLLCVCVKPVLLHRLDTGIDLSISDRQKLLANGLTIFTAQCTLVQMRGLGIACHRLSVRL